MWKVTLFPISYCRQGLVLLTIYFNYHEGELDKVLIAYISLFIGMWYRVKVESNQTNFELIFIEFFKLFFTFWSNPIINFQILSNEFQTNPASEKFDSTL